MEEIRITAYRVKMKVGRLMEHIDELKRLFGKD